jgi:hypothetical protein
MFLALVNCFWVLTCLSKYRDITEKRGKEVEKNWLCSAKPGPACGAPECLVMHWTVSGAQAGVEAPRLKFTGLSGEPTALAANGGLRNPRTTHGLRQRSVGHTGLSGAPTGPKGQRSTAPEKEGDQAPDRYCSCPVVHWTIRCATRQKARIAFQFDLQRLLAALGL